MAAINYRYTWQGINADEVKEQIDPAMPFAPGAPFPGAILDVATDDGFPKSDMDEAMAEQGWQFVEAWDATTPPNTPYPVPSWISLTTGTTALPNGVETTVQTIGFGTISFLAAFFYQWSAMVTKDAAAGSVTFRLKVDGTVIDEVTQDFDANEQEIVAAVMQGSLPTGPHTLELTATSNAGDATYNDGSGVLANFG